MCASVLLLSCLVAAQATAAELKDHPAIKRYNGATLVAATETPFEKIRMELGPLAWDYQTERAAAKKSRDVEGIVFRFLYAAPAQTTAAEVFRNYVAALKTGGFRVLYSCAPSDCGEISHGSVYAKDTPIDRFRMGNASFANSESYFVAAQGGTTAAPLYALVMIGRYEDDAKNVTARPAIYQIVIQPRAAATGQVQVDAAAMKSSIATTGKALLYGVLFDTNSAVLKPASASQLDEIAKYLVANPKINLLVVGHTDNQGALDFNVELSRKRAAAVVQALVSKQGIDAKRLVPRGVGMLAPVESNRTEAGRVKNRRVELVER